MSRLILTVAAILATTSWAAAQPERMTDTQLDVVVAGHLNGGGNPCGIVHPECANNGWGNGFDLTNPGSDNGATAPSKLANGTAGPDNNTNPTTSNGR